MVDTLVFTGNCQAQYLAAVFDGFQDAQAVYHGVGYGTVPSFERRLSRSYYEGRFRGIIKDARSRGDRIILIEQSSLMAQPPDLKLEEAHVVRFPHLLSYALYPAEFCRDHGVATPPNPSRMLRLDLSNLARLQKRSGFPVDITAFCEERFRRQVLFNTPGHPTGPLNALLVEGILRQLQDIDARYGGTDLAVRVCRHEGVNWVTSHPVDPKVAEALGLEWGEGYEEYAELRRALWTEKALDDGTVERIARNMEVLKEDTTFWFVVGAVHWQRREIEPALAASREVLRLTPGHGPFWVGLQTRLLQSGRWLEAESLLDEVRGIFGLRFEADWVLASLYNNLGRYAEALPLAINHLYNIAFNPRSLGVIAHALSGLGRADEIRNYSDIVLRRYPSATKWVEDVTGPFIAKTPSSHTVANDATRCSVPAFDGAN